jgi:hypothetical protein
LVFQEAEKPKLEVKRMKCKLCNKETGESFGIYCGRCDKIACDVMLDLKAELEE